MACSDEIEIEVFGVGGHAALPHRAIDPVVIACQIVMALQTIVSRNIDPLESAVISITNFNGGTGANNVIPSSVKLLGTVRAFKNEVRDFVEKRFKEVVTGIAALHGASATASYHRNYDPTINNAAQTEFCMAVAREVLGADKVVGFTPTMGAEDFGAMLQQKPGCYAALGQGVPAKDSPHNFGLHHPKFDFNDEILPDGIRYFTGVTEKAMPL